MRVVWIRRTQCEVVHSGRAKPCRVARRKKQKLDKGDLCFALGVGLILSAVVVGFTLGQSGAHLLLASGNPFLLYAAAKKCD